MIFTRSGLNNMLALALIFTGLFGLTACQGIGEQLPMISKLDLQIMKGPAEDFSGNLTLAYQHYYLDKDKFGFERSTREFFYSKAKRAKDGLKVNPVIVTENIKPPSLQSDLLSAREELTKELNRSHRKGDIPILAQAQAAFDCQLILILSNAPDTDIRTCQERFENLMLRLEKPLWPRLEYHVLFQSGRSVLERQAIETLKDVANLKKQDRHANLVIGGHTDRLGSPDANYRLSLQRAKAVRNILMQFGVRESEIRLLENLEDYPGFFGLEKDDSPHLQRRVSILVERDLLKQ